MRARAEILTLSGVVENLASRRLADGLDELFEIV